VRRGGYEDGDLRITIKIFEKFLLTRCVSYVTLLSVMFLTEFEVATAETCSADWSCIPNGKAFFCTFCQHQFVPGDEYRAIFTNDSRGPGGNPLTCRPCFDKAGGSEIERIEGLRVAWERLNEEYRMRFRYWYIRDYRC
jgi:hypothetical protein